MRRFTAPPKKITKKVVKPLRKSPDTGLRRHNARSIPPFGRPAK